MPGWRTSSGVSTSLKPRALKKALIPSTTRSRSSSGPIAWRPSRARRQVGSVILPPMMKSQYVSFVGPNQATLAEEELSPERLGPARR